MKGPPLGPGGEDITWPDQVAPWGRKASSTRNLKPQNSNRIMRVRQQVGYPCASYGSPDARFINAHNYRKLRECAGKFFSLWSGRIYCWSVFYAQPVPDTFR